MQPKILYKDDENAMIAGVCAGLADYLGTDAALVRVFTLIFFLLSSGIFFIIYIIMVIIVPTKSSLIAQGKIFNDGTSTKNQSSNFDKKDDFTIDPEDYKL